MLNNKNLYEFNKGTLAILPNGKESSLIYEDDSRYIIDDNPLNIMEDSCKYFGSSYMGRHEGTKSLIGISHKSPIIIEEIKPLEIEDIPVSGESPSSFLFTFSENIDISDAVITVYRKDFN